MASLDSHIDRASLNRCVQQSLWQESQAGAKKPLYDLSAVLDQKALHQLAEATHSGRGLTISFLTKDYLSVGITWVEAMKSIGLFNYIIVAGDVQTRQALQERGIPCIEAALDVGGADPDCRTLGGFTPTGLAVSALKFPVLLSLLKEGFDVIMSDVDAIWFRNPSPAIGATADIAFQRIARFPNPIVRYWGFAACGGFIFFRATPGGVALAEDCLREERTVHDDQLAFNLALLNSEITWSHPNVTAEPSSIHGNRDAEVAAFFEAAARIPIEGQSSLSRFVALALPHHQFWRHDLVPFDPKEIIVCHPNSPKSGAAKLDIFKRLGVACVYAPETQSL
jgi:Nucleotide-diphospho-sugar transferase